MTNEINTPSPNRCRLVLVVSGETAKQLDAQSFAKILTAGDVASVIFVPGKLEEAGWQSVVHPLVTATQSLDIAAIISQDSQTAGRVSADGLQLGQDPNAIEEAIEKFSPKMMIGAANVKTRHNALVIGELQPDYLMFGKPGNDTRPEPHPKNLELGAWWSDMVEIPAITLGGSSVECVVEVAKTGVEFVALGAAIFAPHHTDIDGDIETDINTKIDISAAANQVSIANQLLDDHAPTFENFEY